MILQHKFIDLVPEILEEGVLYVSIEYGCAMHKCACGCGKEVVTPLAPNGWSLTFDGKTVSLYPSIGNWRFPCKSHYWITKNEVKASLSWSEQKKQTNRKRDLTIKPKYKSNKKQNRRNTHK